MLKSSASSAGQPACYQASEFLQALLRSKLQAIGTGLSQADYQSWYNIAKSKFCDLMAAYILENTPATQTQAEDIARSIFFAEVRDAFYRVHSALIDDAYSYAQVEFPKNFQIVGRRLPTLREDVGDWQPSKALTPIAQQWLAQFERWYAEDLPRKEAPGGVYILMILAALNKWARQEALSTSFIKALDRAMAIEPGQQSPNAFVAINFFSTVLPDLDWGPDARSTAVETIKDILKRSS